MQRYQEIYKQIESFYDPDICPFLPPDYVPGTICDTVFTYVLDDKGRKTADRGLENFYRCVSKVLAFNEKFESMTVTDHRSEKEYVFKVIEVKELAPGISHYTIFNGLNNQHDYLIVTKET